MRKRHTPLPGFSSNRKKTSEADECLRLRTGCYSKISRWKPNNLCIASDYWLSGSNSLLSITGGVLKNSSSENSRKIHRARMPYKRFSRTGYTFSITGF